MEKEIDIVRREFRRFLETAEKEHFEDGLSELLYRLNTHRMISIQKGKADFVPAWQNLDDLGLSTAIGQFMDKAKQWNREVKEKREAYLCESDRLMIPDDLYSVFGQLCEDFEELRASALLVLRFVESTRPKEPREEVPVSILAKELDTSKQSLYRLAEKGYISFHGKPQSVYRDQINVQHLKKLLELQKKQMLPGQK